MSVKQRTVPDVANVHDIHVWNLSVGKMAMSAHLLVKPSSFAQSGERVLPCLDSILRTAQRRMREEFGVSHSTIQIEFPHDHSAATHPDYCSPLGSPTHSPMPKDSHAHGHSHGGHAHSAAKKRHSHAHAHKKKHSHGGGDGGGHGHSHGGGDSGDSHAHSHSDDAKETKAVVDADETGAEVKSDSADE